MKILKSPSLKTPIKPTTHHSTHKKIECRLKSSGSKSSIATVQTPNRLNRPFLHTAMLKKNCALDLKMVESYHVNSLRNILSSRSEGKAKYSPIKERSLNSLTILQRKYKYTDEAFEYKKKVFLKLFHVSTNATSSNENLYELEGSTKFQQYIMREFEQTVISPENSQSFDSPGNPNDIKIHSIIPRMFYPALKAKPQQLYFKILIAIGVVDNLMSFEDFIKICYYFIDDAAPNDEWVGLVCKILCPDNYKLMVDELIKFLKDNVRSKLQSRISPLLKAITSNYMLLGIIDSNGIFDPKKFKDSYLNGVLKITDLLCMLNLK